MTERRKDDQLKQAVKEAFKEASREWLDEKYELVGRWTINGLIAALLALLGYLIILVYGVKFIQVIQTIVPVHGHGG